MTDEMKHVASKLGSNELIAHSIAERMLAQVQAGKSKQQVAEDMSQTHSALKLAQKAFYDKDPEAIALL